MGIDYPLEEFMQRITHREYRTRVEHMNEELNHPERSDYYLMQLAGYVSHVMSSRAWSLGDFRIKFKTGQTTRVDKEQQVQQSKSMWARRLGRTTRRDRHGR